MSEKKPAKVWDKSSQWPEEIQLLKSIVAKTPLEETIKWGAPTFTYNKKNVAGIAGFKNYVTIWFYNGVFLKNPKKVLVNAQEGVTKALRQWRFSGKDEIVKYEDDILKYLLEAIENEKAGLKHKPEKKELVIPDVFQNRLDSDAVLAAAFAKMTPGCQREYANYISEAKREETKLSRLDKITPMIKAGGGLNDKYK